MRFLTKVATSFAYIYVSAKIKHVFLKIFAKIARWFTLPAKIFLYTTNICCQNVPFFFHKSFTFLWLFCLCCKPKAKECTLFNTASSAALKDFTVSEDAGINHRTVATLALAGRGSNHAARSHLWLDLIQVNIMSIFMPKCNSEFSLKLEGDTCEKEWPQVPPFPFVSPTPPPPPPIPALHASYVFVPCILPFSNEVRRTHRMRYAAPIEWGTPHPRFRYAAPTEWGTPHPRMRYAAPTGWGTPHPRMRYAAPIEWAQLHPSYSIFTCNFTCNSDFC